MATSRRHNIRIEQGATWRLEVGWEDESGSPIDLTGWSARMQIREEHASANPLVSLTSQPGDGLAIDGPAGLVSIEIPAAVTQTIPAPIEAVYDLEIQGPGGEVERLLFGCADIDPEVTR